MEQGTELAGRYRLEELLGRGGMGQVWRAEDLQLRRQVAVKLLRVDLSADLGQAREILVRFHREGRAMAKLAHRNIAAVYDVGEHSGTPFLVLELLDGSDLRTVLENHLARGIPLPLVAQYGAQAADALAAAHDAEIVHRDIKPANLMVLADNTVKVCDFGIARLRQASTEQEVTRSGVAIGTPAYMPPEQLQGKPVDAAADVYALGATLFHLLTGRLVFPAQDPVAFYAMHAGAPAPQVSSLRSDAPREWDALIASMLSKDPRRRPSAAAAAARLRNPALTKPAAHTARRTRIDVAEALSVARAIEDGQKRAQPLVKIAKVVAESDPVAAKALLTEAERSARTRISSFANAFDLVPIARALAADDPGYAAALLAGAERIVRESMRRDSVGTLSEWHDNTLGDIAEVWAVLDPDRAYAVVGDIAMPYKREFARHRVIRALASAHPVLSESVARALTGRDSTREGWQLAEALVTGPPLSRTIARARTRRASLPAVQHIAVALASVDLAAGVRVARMIRPASRQPIALIAEVAAETEPAAAEALANTLDGGQRDTALINIARVVALTDYPNARRIAASIGNSRARSEAQSAIGQSMRNSPWAAAHIAAEDALDECGPEFHMEACRLLAGHDPAAAEQRARAMTGWARARALYDVALALPASESDRAHALLCDAAADDRLHPVPRFRADIAAAMVKMGSDPGCARAVLSEAADAARRIPHRQTRSTELLYVANVLASIDPAAATHLIENVPIPLYEEKLLEEVITAAAACNPAAGTRLARGFKSSLFGQNRLLAAAAAGAATVGLDAAFRIAETIDDTYEREGAWETITKHLLTVAPGTAVIFAIRLTDELETSTDDFRSRSFPQRVLKLVATIDPEAARRIASRHPLQRDDALASIAEALSGDLS
ncbi:serine/threonine protein kinase [Streptomyces sp. NBC_01275]|uniref:serine/threonine-protein kinase n=1 Tax=Streptomyces sp. NBC_01275 TaxID=2903807 RepID=UPI0022525B0A|nr:serine/threonine-protein kinase [Streptomyces sp. NBC_01275]MCX4767984.1 serine/threonine protein kinase [Streptomyces sp. NBC_01275]